MDPGDPVSRTRSDISFLTRKLRSLNLRQNSLENSVDNIGELGLNLLHEPSDCHADFIFVHGLRGGSRKTWSASPSPAHYWPKEWLPTDPDFRNIRIHSFGYNSDWLDRRENLLTIHDFGQSLIEEIYSSRTIRRSKTTPIVFIGHSMGGLVIKKACILSRENPVYNDIGARIHSIYFLATPHRGSDLARTLNKVLKATLTGSKPFVGSLERGSETINLLNEQFRHVCRNIAIHSFTESLPTNYGVGSGLVVDMQSAKAWCALALPCVFLLHHTLTTVDYPDERIQALNANHRNICKFDSPNDTNFRTLRNRLATTVEDIELRIPKAKQQAYRQEMQTISRFLNVSGSPIDDLAEREDGRIPGSCEWVTNSEAFLDWQYGDDSPQYFWLTGQPAVGKSVITAHVIGCLDENKCSYYFFKHVEQNKSSLSGALLSVAYQMAQKSYAIREVLLELANNDSFLDKDDYRGIWRRLFVGGIFRTDFAATQYWVIDALDECLAAEKRAFDSCFALLTKIDPSIPLKIFVSSRSSVDLERLFVTLSYVNIQITAEDSIRDIRLYVETHADDLPAEDEATRKGLVETMVRKSAGCFLWTVLVMRQLQEIYTSDEIDEVLQEVPEEMDELYRRNLQIMESRPRTKKLAQTVLIWTLCATRALTLDELKDAIRLDVGIVVVRDLERSISTLCSQFLFVDKQNKIQIAHETARTFLLNPDLKFEFRVQMPLGNVQLGLACLRCLTSDDMAVRINRGGSRIHALAEYASLSFSEHLVHSTSSSDALFLALMEFLQKDVLVWIERMARENNLGYLMKTAMHLKAYQESRAKHVATLQDVVSSWAIDLPRIVTVFGRNLSKHPEAIYHIIPPLCPRSSGIYRQFGTSATSLQLRGLSEPEWNDRISSWNYGNRARSITCQDRWFAIGLSDGMIHIYWTSTCQESVKMNHGESVVILRFGNLARTLVSTGLRMVKFWDVSSGSLLWEYRINWDHPLAVEFDVDDKKLVVATRTKKLFTWSTINGTLISQNAWHHQLNWRRPLIVVMSSSHKLMAIVYRSMPLCLWDLDRQQELGLCTRASDDGSDTGNNIISACFNPVQALNLIAVAYDDGDIALFDTLSRNMKRHAKAQTPGQLLAASPDGRTLAGGDSDGNIKLFDFETLQLLYRINLSSYGVGALSFTGDSLRLIELRGAQANVWEPSALVRRWNYADDDFSSEAPAKSIQDARMHLDDEENITVIQAVYEESMAICGRAGGSVGLCDISSSEPAFQELYKHKGTSILSLDWNESHKIVATGDNSGRFKVMRLVNDRQDIVTVSDEYLDAHLPSMHSIGQLMISPDGKKLLVSSSTADFVWSLQTRKLILSREINARTDWRWLPHPQESTKLMLLESSLLQTFSWNASTVFTPETEIAIRIGNHRPVDLKSMALETNNNKLILKLGIKEDREFSSAVHGAEETSLCTLDLSEIRSQPEFLLPEPLFLSEGVSDLPRVKALLGFAPGSFGGLLLVFIAESGWICSIDLNIPPPHSTFQRHFFIPSAWLSTNTRIVSAITTRKDILFVRDHEVAIIKNGLEAVEVIRLS